MNETLSVRYCQIKEKKYTAGELLMASLPFVPSVYIISYGRVPVNPVSINVLSNAEVEYESHK